VTRRVVLCLACLVVLGLGLVACGGDDDKDAASTTTTRSPDAAATQPGSPTSEADTIDACRLLETSEIEPYIGAVGEGTGSGGSCEWRNNESFESVSITMNPPGTVVDGLPDQSAYPDVEPVDGVGDDARYSPANGIVEFAVGDRTGQLQLASVSMDAGKLRTGAVELTKLAVDRI
jgi:hypothetical protein